MKRLLAALAILLNIALFAQTGTIKGKIKTSDGKPAEFVNIGIKATPKGAIADGKGEFEIKNVTPGTYTIITSFVGLETKELTVTVKEGVNTIPDIVLKESAKTLTEVVVDARKNQTVSDHVAKVSLKNIENSQVYSVVDKQLIESQQINNMEDALRNAAGVSIVFAATGRSGDGGTYYTTRGFTTSASLMNGVAGAVFSNPDVINVERVEVLKGPSATLFGSSLTSFGGAINIITKKPYDSLGGQIAVTGGSWGLNRITADVNTPLNKAKTAAFRLNAAYHYQHSFQDYGFTRRVSASPSFSYKVNSRLSFNLETNFSQIQGTLVPWFYADSATTGVTSADQLTNDYYKYYFPGDMFTTTKTANVIGQMEYKINDRWKSQTIFSSSTNVSAGPSTYLWFISDTALTRNHQTLEGTTRQMNVQQNFIGDFKIGTMRNRFVGGVDFYQNYTESQLPMYNIADTVYTNVPNPNYMDYNLTNYTNSGHFFYAPYTGVFKTQRFGAYVSDVLNVTDYLLLNVGVRFDRFINQGDYNPAADTTTGAFSQNTFSPKFGLVYQFIKDKAALFANYQNSFQNVTGRDFDGNVFKPQQANQWEAGFKFSLWKNRINSTISYYNILVNNVVRADVNHPMFSIQDGEQRSRGIEAEVNVNFARGFYAMVGYGYNNNIYVRADASVEGRRPLESGPAHLVNVWLSYTVEAGPVRGLGVGFGGNYASRKYTNNDTYYGIFTIPAYTVLNSSVYFDRPAYRVSFNVNNMANKKYWIGWNQMAAQNPREWMATVAWKF